ncbi:MAG: glycosyltransferase [Sedimentisphaerales bacterium]|nr:glycosyltransferase [Sedimentisphaerales bacterium]
MKIAICAPMDLAGSGGVETHILSLAAALRELGVEVSVFGDSDGADFCCMDRCRPGDYQIIHTHGCGFSRRFIRWALENRRRADRPAHVHTLHGLSLGYLLACGTWFNWRCYSASLAELVMARHAEKVIAVSGNTKRQAQKFFRLGPGKTQVIPNGYNPDKCNSGNRQAIRSRLGLGSENLVLLFVGRGEDRVKGTALISDAMDELYERHGQVRLLAVPGSGFPEAKWLCRAGRVDHDKIVDYYRAADIFVNASKYEGFPLTIVEAMGAGLAVVAAPVGGITEIVQHEKNGLLLRVDRGDLAEKVELLIADKNLRSYLGQNGRVTAQELTWEKIARRTITEIYEPLLNSAAENLNGRSSAEQQPDKIQTENLTVSVIIPTLNRSDSLLDTLDSVLKQSVKPSEVIVVDQSESVDEQVSSFCREHNIILEHLSERGSHRARNRAMGLATGDILFFCDDDCELDEGVLENHLKNYADQNVGAVGGRLLQPSEQDDAVRLDTNIKCGSFNRWSGKVTGKFYSTVKGPIDHFSGGNCSGRRELLIEAGGYDENFGGNAFFEETDLALRIKKLGGQIIFEPAGRVVHLHCEAGGNRAGRMKDWVFWFSHNYLLLFWRHGKKIGLPVFFARLSARWLWWSVRHKKPTLIFAGVRGFCRGCKDLRQRVNQVKNSFATGPAQANDNPS